MEVELLAASLRADLTDIAAFTEGLATKLEGTLPGLVQVQRVKQGFRGPKVVNRIALDTGDARLELKRDGGLLQAIRSRISGGIVLKTEQIDIETWLSDLAAAVAVQAQRSERTRQALENLLLES